jgi:hypothetical protein
MYGDPLAGPIGIGYNCQLLDSQKQDHERFNRLVEGAAQGGRG